MQPYRQTYVETYRVSCPHDDCDDLLYVTITRERGGKIEDVSVSHTPHNQELITSIRANRLTENPTR